MTSSAKTDSDGWAILTATKMQTIPATAGVHRTATSLLKLLIALTMVASVLAMSRVYGGNSGEAN